MAIDYNSLIEKGNQQYEALINIAKGGGAAGAAPSIENMSDGQKDRWLLAKGYRPDIDAKGDIDWIMPKRSPIEQLSMAQKVQGSVSPESLFSMYPAVEYARDNFVPYVLQLAAQVSDPDVMMSVPAFYEAINKLAKEGTKVAIEATGGLSMQGKSKLAKAANPEQAQAILTNTPKAIDDYLKQSEYQKNKTGGE